MNAIRTVINTGGFLRSHPSAAVVGSIVGIALAFSWPAVMEEWYQWIDSMYPPTTAKAYDITRTVDAVEWTLLAERKRGDCRYAGQRVAYARPTEGLLREIYLRRLDVEAEVGVQLPVDVPTRLGRWRAYPTAGATSVEMWALYACNGRQVQAKLVTIDVR